MCTMKWPFSREGWLCPREGRGRKDLEEQHEKEHGSEVSRIWVNPTSLLCHFKGGRGPTSLSLDMHSTYHSFPGMSQR